MVNVSSEEVLRPMMENDHLYAIVTARAGSKGIPRKNLRKLNGIPLIGYTLRAATSCPLIRKTILSTDDENIATVGESYGAEIVWRPWELATDVATSRDVVYHVLQHLDGTQDLPKYFVLLQPTSPLRNEVHITECINGFIQSRLKSAVSVVACEEHPFKSYYVEGGGRFAPVRDWASLEEPRQTLPDAYRPNGAIYVMQSETFMRERKLIDHPFFSYRMNHRDSADIDTEEDIAMVEMILKGQGGERS